MSTSFAQYHGEGGGESKKDMNSFLEHFRALSDELQDALKGILLMIGSVSSKTFQHYKLKDLSRTFDVLTDEFHRLHVFNIMPVMEQHLQRLRAEAACAKLARARERSQWLLLRRSFDRYKQGDKQRKVERLPVVTVPSLEREEGKS